MVNALVVTLKSGKQIGCNLDPTESEGKTPEECCKIFHNNTEWSSLVTMQLGSLIFFAREIETIELITKEEPKTEMEWTCSVCGTNNPVFKTHCVCYGKYARFSHRRI